MLEEEASDSWMQNVAAEMNLSETAFLHKVDREFNLRWFTPTIEVDLCGHATLASAHILWEEGHLDANQDADFHTKSGMLKASKTGDLIELDFPSDPEEKAQIPEHLREGLGVDPIYVGKSRFDYLVHIESEEILRNLKPDFNLIKKVKSRGVIVTSTSASSDYDFVSRFFAPASGIDEDPATGSAHCCLAPFWHTKLGKKEMNAFQASKRGGVLHVSLKGDRVLQGGNATTVFRGEMT